MLTDDFVFALEVVGSTLVVLLLLEDAEVLAPLKLATLLVHPARKGILDQSALCSFSHSNVFKLMVLKVNTIYNFS